MNEQERIDYLNLVERHAKANAEFGVAVAEGLLKDAGTLLNMLIAGIGGGIALIVQMIRYLSGYPSLIYGLVASTAYLTIIAIVLMVKCIKTRYVYAPTNSPKNLLVALDKKYEAVSLDAALTSVLHVMDGTISKNSQSNELVARWLDRCRMATVLTPVGFVITAAVAYLLSSKGLPGFVSAVVVPVLESLVDQTTAGR